MKRMRRIGVGFIGVIVLVVVGRNVIARAVIVNGVKAATGVNVGVDRLHIGLMRSRVAAEGVTVLNPPGFPEPVMVSLPELVVEYDLLSFLRGAPHLKRVRVHLADVTVIRDEQGRVNVNSLRPVQQQQQKQQQPMQVRIDELDLKVGRVVYKDYSRSRAPIARSYDVNIDERFEHITNAQAVVSTILLRSLAKTTVGQLANIDMTALRGSAIEGLKGAADDVLHSVIGDEGAALLDSLWPGRSPSQHH